MRVRIKRDPHNHRMWDVEVKDWWTGWRYNKCFSGDQAQERALAAAEELLNPTIIEVFKPLKEKHGEKAST